MIEKEQKEMINDALEIAEEMIPRTAKIIKKLYDELLKNGFSEEVAIAIVSKYQIGGSR